MTAFMPIYELVDQPKVVDIIAGRPYRLVGIPVPMPATGMTNIQYWLEFLGAGNGYSETVLMGMGPEPMPAFDLTGQQTAQLGTLLAAASPTGYDNTGDKTAVGSWRIFAQGTDPNTTEAVTAPAGFGPALLRLNTPLTRKDRILLGQGTCGCVTASSCGCGSGCNTCDHELPGIDPDPCNVLVERSMIKGRWRGYYTDLDPVDGLGPYIRYDVVEMPDTRRYAFVGPANGISLCLAPGETYGP